MTGGERERGGSGELLQKAAIRKAHVSVFSDVAFCSYFYINAFRWCQGSQA